MRVFECKTHRRNESEYKMRKQWQHRPTLIFCEGLEVEHTCQDPKDGELYLGRVKPGETLVEARSGTDVQIVRQI